MRGEDCTTPPPPHTSYGAPPRAWGGLVVLVSAAGYGRSTPTCVGRTVMLPGWLGPKPEHPHVRGEDVPRQDAVLENRGAPPRAWGGHCRTGRAPRRVRSTPTCVGRTLARRCPGPRWSEHPHVRGEDLDTSQKEAMSNGAPPRAWGGHEPRVSEVTVQRSTPTCVGRTPVRLTAGCCTAEHPHVRGEDGAGVEPRASRCRSTPTCVGRTLRDLRFYQPWARFCVGRVVVSYGCGCMLMPLPSGYEWRGSNWGSTMTGSMLGSGASLTISRDRIHCSGI